MQFYRVVRDRIELSTFRFSGSSVPADLSMYASPARDPRATSVLCHDRLGKLRRIAACGQLGQGRSDLGVTAVDRVQIAVGRCGGCVTEAKHQILSGRASGGSKSLAGVPQIMIMPTSA